MTSLSLLLLLCTFPFLIKCATSKKTLDWWQTEIMYQIYPRSFMDSNADGIGDLRGVYQKLNYLKDLGVGAIWFSPIFSSPMVDFGYDISNYREIWPTFGTMHDFDRLLRKAKKLGLKILLDFVPNHTSDKHEWFEKSVKQIHPYTDYYVWKDPKYKNGKRYPPNNWLSNFGNGAWEWNDDRGQYYLHQFAIQQPDLNYRNPIVYEEMKNIIKFWLDKGVDGFRVDAINYLYENQTYPDEPLSHKPNVLPDEYFYLNHIYSKNQPETFEVVSDWRAILEEYSKKGSTRFMMTEAYSKNIGTIMKFYGTKNKPGAHLPFNFMFITDVDRGSNASYIRDQLVRWYKNMPDFGWANWVIGNHDNSRPASRFGHFIIDGLHMIQMLLPGTPIVYNGDEMAMEDTFIRWEQTVDPSGLNAGPDRYTRTSRDMERSPFQWDNTENAGFTKSLHTWLPVNPGYWKINVQEESKITNRITHLQVFKKLAQLRRNVVFEKGDLNLYVISDWVLVLTRSYIDHSTFIVLVNFDSEIVICDLHQVRSSLPEELSIIVPSVNSDYTVGQIVNTGAIKLRPKASVVVTTSEEDIDIEDANDKFKLAPEAIET